MGVEVQLLMERERLALGLDQLAQKTGAHALARTEQSAFVFGIVAGALGAAANFIRRAGSGIPGELQHAWLERASGGFTSDSGRLYAVVCQDRTGAPDHWTITIYARSVLSGLARSIDRLPGFVGTEFDAKTCAEIMLADLRAGASR